MADRHHSAVVTLIGNNGVQYITCEDNEDKTDQVLIPCVREVCSPLVTCLTEELLLLIPFLFFTFSLVTASRRDIIGS